jgi:propionyl-CoA synthetase
VVVLKAGVSRDAADICAELVTRVRDDVGPVANFKQVAIVPRLPKTRSGKVLRRTMRMIADGEAFQMPATIDDPAVLDEIRAALVELGYALGSGATIGE